MRRNKVHIVSSICLKFNSCYYQLIHGLKKSFNEEKNSKNTRKRYLQLQRQELLRQCINCATSLPKILLELFHTWDDLLGTDTIFGSNPNRFKCKLSKGTIISSIKTFTYCKTLANTLKRHPKEINLTCLYKGLNKIY